jgi:ribA/ribD-fused uncharacterized protein
MNNIKTYNPLSCAVFCKVKDEYGAFSNMAGGYPILINDHIFVRSSEALYQACRFPKHPEVQQLILDQKSPMAAKMVSKPYKHLTRADWDQVKVSVMYWCLEQKFQQHFDRLWALLDQTQNKPIVELSKRDDFWGAIPRGNKLVGENMLGQLLMILRDNIRSQVPFSRVILLPGNVDKQSFKLLNEPIQVEELIPQTRR